MGAALGKVGQALRHTLDPSEHMARFRRVVMLRKVLKDLLEITYRIPDLRGLLGGVVACELEKATSGSAPATSADSGEALKVRYLEVRTERQEIVPDAYSAESCKAHRSISFQ